MSRTDYPTQARMELLNSPSIESSLDNDCIKTISQHVKLF